jgi:N-acetylglucosamine-6-phosphate deacetylase
MSAQTGGLVALRGRVVTDYEVWPGGAVLLEGRTILDVLGAEELVEADEFHDYPEHLLVPGFVDLQVNGGYGVDLFTEPERAGELARDLISTGTTSFLPTLISSPRSLYDDALPKLAEAQRSIDGGAEMLGVHLEGPFLSMDKRGAHAAAHVIPPDTSVLVELLDEGPVRMLTIAPELDGASELMELAAGRGVVVSLGHSSSPFQVAYEAFDHWAASVTHLFNAMGPLHHREPGLAGAAFAHPRVSCGLISDGLHVHPEVVSLAFRMLGPDRVYLVTDATAATGSGPGEYRLATRTVYLESNVARLGSGALAGSLLTMDEAFQNVLAFTGCTIPEAVRMAATTPARLIGEDRRKGRLVPGFDADVAVLAPDLSVEAVYKAGRLVYSRERV